MSQTWPTKEKDVQTAQKIMEQYANNQETRNLGFLEVVVNSQEKRMNFRLSGWIVLLAKHFNSIYGATHGDFVTRQIISQYIKKDATVH